MSITTRYQALRNSIPPTVAVVLAAKTRTPDEIAEAIAAGATDVGYNYVQEAATMREALGPKATDVRWHCIGHLQSNKIKRALQLFDTIQTVDSVTRAAAIDGRVEAAGRGTVDVLLEINSAREAAKEGLPPEAPTVVQCAREIAKLPHLRLRGLMTMGPADAGPDQPRPFFPRTAQLLARLRDSLPECRLDQLSMGMSESYLVAVEEGSTMVRVGTMVFGPR
jgi:PLP dependent protein